MCKEMFKCLRAGLTDRVAAIRARASLLVLAMLDHVNFIQVPK